MDIKQIRLEKLVISYFNQRDDTSARPIPGGRYKVKLTSDIARTEFGRGMSDELNLVFDTDDAYNYKEAELITSNHPLLDIIRNDLERREDQDPRVSEAYMPLQLVNPKGDLTIPKLELFNLQGHDLNLTVSYTCYYVFTYRVVYEMDGGSENIVKITIDGTTGYEVHDLLPRIDDNLLLSGHPNTTKVENSTILVQEIQNKSSDILRMRVIEDLETVGKNNTAQLGKEIKRIEEYYANLIKNIEDKDNNSSEIIEIQKSCERELDEWKAKFAYKIKIEPLSILRLWLPNINYELLIHNSRANFSLDQIVYAFDTDETVFQKCKKCGNIQKFNVCYVGEHTVCAATCNEKIASCNVCHDEFCEKHGGECSSCDKSVCNKDSRRCAYGSHSRDQRYCPECISDSFEKKAICISCQEVCDQCGRKFPHELMTVCRIGSERICVSHEKKPDGYKCSECGEYSCSNHGSLTEDHEWACEDHQMVSSCCGKKYRKSALEICCCNNDEYLCRYHSVKCFECGKAVCESHRFPLKDHRGKYVCENCRKVCSECPSDKSYVSGDLHPCNECRKKVCKAHQNICVIGGEILCSKHINQSVTGEILCKLHTGYCIHTGIGEGKPIYRVDQLLTCVVCNKTVCLEHRKKCEICKRNTVCISDISTRSKCLSCGSWSCGHNGCSHSSHTCRYCGMAYCQNCTTSQGICKTCGSLQVLQNTAQWFTFLGKIPQLVGGENGRILQEILLSPDRLKLLASSNKSYSVVVVRYSPHFLEFWKDKQQFRLVVTKTNGKLINIRREKVA